MKITVLKYPSDEDWMLVKKAAFRTIGKDTERQPELLWKRRLLQAVHSPIRLLNYAVLIEDIPSWVSVHLVRHIHAQPFVSTQRNDRVNEENYDRRKAPQDTPVSMIWYFNAEELMTICHKRLCMLASEETRKVIQDICKEIIRLCPEFDCIDVLVPLCTYRGGICTEFHPCEYYKNHGHGFISPKLQKKSDISYEQVLNWLTIHVGFMTPEQYFPFYKMFQYPRYATVVEAMRKEEEGFSATCSILTREELEHVLKDDEDND